jgi:lipopolysaccharide export system protein LptC
MAFGVTLPRFGAAGELPPHLAGRESFRAAARHSRRVRLLRLAIPWMAGAVTLFLVLRAVSGLFFSGDVSVSAFKIEGRKLVMEKPKLSGFKNDGSSYEMTAENAVQDLKRPNVVELSNLKARMQTGAAGWANLSGDNGVYDSKAERLLVRGNVQVKTDTGTEAFLRDADIEFKSGTVITNNPSEVRTAQGNVTSDRLEVRDNGRRLVFEGNVHSEFVNAGAADAPSAQ